MRLQFWRDAISKTFQGSPPKEPTAVLLYHALEGLKRRGGRLNKGWFLRVITAREQYLHNPPYPSMSALESYAESTYSALLYLSLESLPLYSVTVDHLASHIGKATGITAVLRGLPLLAFPPPPKHHSNRSGSTDLLQGGTRQGAVPVPLDVMAEAGLKEEDVYRQGASAPGLRDAVFAVATRANDHLITAREMLKHIRAGMEIDHDFEHGSEDGHDYTGSGTPTNEDAKREINRAFGVLMPAVSTRTWLERLEKADFDIFRPELRRSDWRLPWKAYWAFRRQNI